MLWQNKVLSLEICKREKICTAHAWCLLGGTWDYGPRRTSLHGGCHRAERLWEMPGGDSALNPGLLGLEIHSLLQFFWRWQHLSTSLNLKVHKIPLLASSYRQCADLALDWERTSGKVSLAHALGIHVAASAFASSPLLSLLESMLFLLEMSSSFLIVYLEYTFIWSLNFFVILGIFQLFLVQIRYWLLQANIEFQVHGTDEKIS